MERHHGGMSNHQSDWAHESLPGCPTSLSRDRMLTRSRAQHSNIDSEEGFLKRNCPTFQPDPKFPNECTRLLRPMRKSSSPSL